jgi:hypothetical protein
VFWVAGNQNWADIMTKNMEWKNRERRSSVMASGNPWEEMESWLNQLKAVLGSR